MGSVSDDDLIAAYERLGSVWSVGEMVGLSGQSVHERLKRAGVKMGRSRWTDLEDEMLSDLIAEGLSAAAITDRMPTRTFNAVAGRMNALGLKVQRSRKPESKSPLDEMGEAERARRLLRRALDENRSLKSVCQEERVYVQKVANLCAKYVRQDWKTYLARTSALPDRECEYCSAAFTPANGKQRFCNAGCASVSRTDRRYFNGNRRNTVGLDERTCQACARRVEKGLSSHHVLGRDNDPEGEALIALCTGCHKMVGEMAGWIERFGVGGPLDGLLGLAWARAHGAEFSRDHLVEVTTDFEYRAWDDEVDGGGRSDFAACADVPVGSVGVLRFSVETLPNGDVCYEPSVFEPSLPLP